jgi:hypothetical protein
VECPGVRGDRERLPNLGGRVFVVVLFCFSRPISLSYSQPTELSRKIEEEKSKIPAVLSEDEHLKRLDDIENAKFDAAKRCNAQDQAVHTSEAKIQRLKARIKSLTEEKARLQHENSVVVPKCK